MFWAKIWLEQNQIDSRIMHKNDMDYKGSPTSKKSTELLSYVPR